MFNQHIKFVKQNKIKAHFFPKKNVQTNKNKNKIKKHFFRKTQATKEKQGNRAKISFLEKKHANFEQIWEAKHFLEILENADQMIFFLERPTKSVPQEHWWFKRVLKMYDCQFQCKLWFGFRKYFESHSHLKDFGKAGRSGWKMIWLWTTIEERKKRCVAESRDI